MTNKLFCYWLQGYFEISQTDSLSKGQINAIQQQLFAINEPLGIYTQWLQKVLNTIMINDYNRFLIDDFAPLISQELNVIFVHDIDNSYDTHLSPYELASIHTGDAQEG